MWHRKSIWRTSGRQAQPRFICALSFPVYSVLLASASRLHFPKIVSFLCSVRTKDSCSAPRFIPLLDFSSSNREKIRWCVPHSTDLSCCSHSWNWPAPVPKDNSFHKVRTSGLWAQGIFQIHGGNAARPVMAMADILRMIDNNSFVVKMKVNSFTNSSECLANYRRT